ncbi:MAG: hypothetical protein WAS73_10550 [Defluviicoccus sp.]
MLDKRCPRWLGVAFLAGLAVLPQVAGADDGPLPARLQNLVMREVDAAVARNDACPSTPAMTVIAAAHGGIAVALDSYTSDLLARSRERRAADPCACLQSIAAATIRAQPAQAAPVHRALRERFPQCSEVVLVAVQGTLGTLSVAGTAPGESTREPRSAALSTLACPEPAMCISIEPSPADVASKTHRRY